MQTELKPKRIPYGIQGFEMLRNDNSYYVDKTMFIPEMENANKYFFIVRPRRFGKTLLLNMLKTYYDIKKKDIFDKMFSGLWIHDNPTENRNSYLVLHLNFAMVSGSIDDYRQSFDGYCDLMFKHFCKTYKEFYPEDAQEQLVKREYKAIEQLKYIVSEVVPDKKIYFFIDEYDNFTNNILSDHTQLGRYMDETHRTGYLRTFFNALKDGCQTSIERLFITGVSPVTLDDLTSGFNIGTNYSTDARFNELMGFTENDVREMVRYYDGFYHFQYSEDEIIETIRPWYDNYCFAEDAFGKTTMYNSDMILYFMDNLCSHNEFPKKIIDSNIRTDYAKLKMLIRKDREFKYEASIIQKLATDGQYIAPLNDHFPAEKITEKKNFVSLLYYFGMVSIGGLARGEVIFKIPNIVVREQLFEYLIENYEENDLKCDSWIVDEALSQMAFDGVWKPFFDYTADLLKKFAASRDKAKGESFVHGFTLAATCRSHVYFAHSEPDTSDGFPDLYLEPRTKLYHDLTHSYLIEFKYAKSDATETEITNKTAEGILQLEKYSKSGFVVEKSKKTTLHCLLVVYKGVEMVKCEQILEIKG